MSTEAQVAANRENAQKSTGPKTQEGKARAAHNALKHGLFSADVVLMGESAEDLDAFREAWMADLAPEGPREEYQANRAVEYAWRLRRIPRLEQRYSLLAVLPPPSRHGPTRELARCTAESRLGFWDDLAAGVLANRKFLSEPDPL